MDCTTSSYVPSDDWGEGFMSEEQIHEAVLAAGKKAKISGLSGGYAGRPSSDTTNAVFGYSNADAYKDRVAIRNLSLQADLSLVREWIRLCDDNHADSNSNCLPKDGILLQGFTVIDCEDGRNILVSGTASMKYVTLSYVWGAEVSEGPDQFGKLPSTLPNLITDVIKVVIALGYRYLWIDRYCVPQNDSSDTKFLLIKNMDKIYSQSILTIIATTAKCPSEGLPGITKPRITVQKFLQMNSVHLVQWVSNIRHEIDSSEWNKRGWTYQEALLSRRRLVFTETQCYFQCDAGGFQSGKGGCRMESIDYDFITENSGRGRYRIPMIFRPRPKHYMGREVSTFGSLVSDYTKRQLSKDSDVLPAFLGILGMFISECSIFHGHIYGVPIFELGYGPSPGDSPGTLIMGITWYFEKQFWSLEDINAAVIPVRRRALPSWTWCDWIHASPSPYSIEWPMEILPRTYTWRHMAHNRALSLEFEDGTILPWSCEHNVADLAKKAMTMGDVRSLHIVGWFTHLSVPESCDLEDEFWDWLPCGPYRIQTYEVVWLQRLAKERVMNVTENKEYIFKAWVFTMVAPANYFSVNGDRVHMMLLGETSQPSIFERIEICEIKVKLKREREGEEKSVEDVAKRLGWEMKAFELV